MRALKVISKVEDIKQNFKQTKDIKQTPDDNKQSFWWYANTFRCLITNDFLTVRAYDFVIYTFYERKIDVRKACTC